MRIVVNDVAATPSSGGGYQVLKDFYNEVLKSDNKNFKWIFLLSGDYFKTSDNVKIINMNEEKTWLNRLKFDLFSGKKIIKDLKADAYISLQNTATLGLEIPQFVYLQQIIPYQKEVSFSFFKKEERRFAIYQKIIGRIFNFLFKFSSATVIVQTKTTKELVERKINSEILTCYPKVKIKDNLKSLNTNSNIFIYPAGDYFYKNHDVIIQASKILKEKGINNFKILFTIKDRKIDDLNIIQIGLIDKDVLFDEMKVSNLLFTSSFESFGLPLEEARLMGINIIAPNLPYAKEILNEYPNAYFFELNNPGDLALTLENILNSGDKKVGDFQEKGESLMNLLVEKLYEQDN